MKLVTKLAGLWLMGRGVSTSTPLMAKLVMMIAATTLFAVIAAVLGMALIFGVLILGYMQFIAIGVTPSTAVLILMAVVVALLAGVVGIARHYLRHVRTILKAINYVQHPLQGRAQRIVDAFFDGYHAPAAAAR